MTFGIFTQINISQQKEIVFIVENARISIIKVIKKAICLTQLIPVLFKFKLVIILQRRTCYN